jgi:hypothetical protein
MKRWIVVLGFVMLFALAGWAQPSEQHGDVSFGVGTMLAPTPSSAEALNGALTLNGGTFLSVAANYQFWHHAGVGFDFTWRASEAVWEGIQPYRPIIYTFNGIYAPRIGKRAQLELLAGIGVLDTHFYQTYETCSFVTCTNYTTSNDFTGDFGVGVRLFARGGVFIRPEVREYVFSSNADYLSGHATRAGVSLGYAF